MKRLGAILASALALMGLGAAPASAAFGIKDVGFEFTDPGGAPSLQAGSHPFANATTIAVNTTTVPEGGACESELCELPDGAVKDVTVELPAGFVGDPSAVPRCSAADFIVTLAGPTGPRTACPDATVLGIAAVAVTFAPAPAGSDEYLQTPVFNLIPPPGVAARLGFAPAGVRVTVDFTLNPNPPYNVIAHANKISQIALFLGSVLTVWGDPSSPAHDSLRGDCVGGIGPADEPISLGECPVPPGQRKPFFTVPRSCTGPLETTFTALAWNTGETDFKEALTEPGMVGCPELGFNPSIGAKPTTLAAQSPTGLDFSLDVADEGLTSPTGRAASDIRKVVATLPAGISANPSLAEGLAVCTEEQLQAETAFSGPGEGCPNASKIGSVEVETPLLEENVDGALYIAKPYQNLAEDSLIALYVVIRNPTVGIVVRQALKVEADPETGQLITTTTEDIPQLPFSHFRLHFREGARSPLISPPGCDADPSTAARDPYTVSAELTPWSGGAPLESTSTFQIISGPGEGPCPPGGVAPFHPGFTAGSINNSAGSYSPFYMRLTRRDGEQDMTKFSSVLPPGVVGRIAGLSKCPEAQIAQAKARSGAHGAQEELDAPSCPASSKIGRTLAGAGVGSQLTYVPGSLYLAGPVAGDPLSVVSITPAKAGPFDAGTVVVREALTLNPETAEVEVDGSHSDPIPHILKGIPLNVRDLRVYADKPNFILNPTDCEPSEARATLFGSYLDVLNPSDDVPVGLQARYQAADCAALPFKPRLQIELKGGTKRGGHPALTATVTPRPGDANFAGAVVTLPHSAFLDQAHIRTICTRVQFAEAGGNGAGCPAGAIYGQATAYSPLLDEALTGPVYLRSSDHNLPDLVIALHGLVNINLASRIDSFKGGIRSTFEAIPDAPVSRFVLEMQGGAKGLIVNSTDLCKSTNRAVAKLTGQNGMVYDTKPVLGAKCPKGKRHHKRHRRHRRATR